MRHAEAQPGRAGLPDSERRLTETGTADAAAIGRFLLAENSVPDIALCSDARRARETLAALSEVLPSEPEAWIDADLYKADAGGLLDHLRLHGGRAKRLLVIGHNPAVGELAASLARESEASGSARLQGGFPPAALAMFRTECSDWEGLRSCDTSLYRFVTPQSLRG